MKKKKIVIPKFLAHLRTFAGMPVPVTAQWFGDKPDLRVTNHDEVVRCVTERLCGICGRSMQQWAFFIGGDLSKKNHLFHDPPMHMKCAQFSAEYCPFLNGEREDFSERPAPRGEGDLVVEADMLTSHERPAEMFILRARAKDTRMVEIDGGSAIQAGPWFGVELIKDKGRKK